MKSFVCTVTSLSFVEFIILVICFCFFIKQFTFEDYMSELYRKNQDLLSEDNKHGQIINQKNLMPCSVLMIIVCHLFMF